jgi:hypothetical protein
MKAKSTSGSGAKWVMITCRGQKHPLDEYEQAKLPYDPKERRVNLYRNALGPSIVTTPPRHRAVVAPSLEAPAAPAPAPAPAAVPADDGSIPTDSPSEGSHDGLVDFENEGWWSFE